MTTHRTSSDSLILNDEQIRFIRHIHGPGMLHASVGTGKTLALAERAAEAIRQGADPRRILCVTFTNRAADEMRERIMRRCGRASRSVRVMTFHALCAWMLRGEAKHIGLPRDFTIYDDVDTEDLLRPLVGRQSDEDKTLKQVAGSIAQAKAEAAADTLNADLSLAPVFKSLPDWIGDVAVRYQRLLRNYHAVDFSDLIFFTRCMLHCYPDIRERWMNRFDFVQVDEVQDTHMAEYEVVSLLARNSGNLVLAGDFDQTIYEWRGSEPGRVLSRFRREFPDAECFHFSVNYRSTRALLEAAAAVARSFSPHRPPQPCSSARDGEPPLAHFARDEYEEARWISGQVRRLNAESGVPYDRVAVLVRTNQRAGVISRVLQDAGIPHLTVEQYEFFRRQEVKDALAYLRFLVNPWDEPSLRRLLQRPPRGIGVRTLQEVAKASSVGLRLKDLVSEEALAAGDPLAPLLAAWKDGDLVVFDTETTGLDPAVDEIVEIAAVKLHRGKPVTTFHRYLQNTVSVGDSEAVHGLSDAFLQDKGESPGRVLAEFAQFAGGSLLVGHNVRFDMRMLRSNALRNKVPVPENAYFDTLDIAQRFVESEDYKLETLAKHFGLGHMPQHQALDDVKATCELLEPLLARAARSATSRREAMARFAPAFSPLAAELSQFRSMFDRRPPVLLKAVMYESGLYDYYGNEPRRQANLRELQAIMEQTDREEFEPRESLERFLIVTSLARNVDLLVADDDRVKILTVHQAKGLEFDVVFIAGLSDGEFPNYLSLRENREAEERRVFYVAITRAKERLFLSGYGMSKGWRRRPSPYFRLIDSIRTVPGEDGMRYA